VTASQVQNIPRGYVEVSRTALEAKIDQMQHFLKEDEGFAKMVKDWLSKNVESEIFYIDKNVERLIGRISDREETSVFLRALEFINNVFKQNKLLSVGFPLRNAAGNLTNMNLAGMSMKDIFEYVRKSNIALKKGGKWFVNDILGVLDNLTGK